MNSITDDLRPLDEQAFGARVEPHRRELHLQCYRLLGSFEEAEDLVQEAFLRAWRRRETYEGRASVRAWPHRIATNVLVLRDVLVCSAKETARLLETTEASVNSALQRARAGLRESLPEDRGGFGSEAFGSTRCVVTRANGQPAVAGYVRKPGDAAYEPLAIDVLRVQDGVVTEIVTFDGAVFAHFDLPAILGATGGTR
jgi:hypothetical protein